MSDTNDQAVELLRELVEGLCPSVLSQLRYSQHVQSAIIRARELIERHDRSKSEELQAPYIAG